MCDHSDESSSNSPSQSRGPDVGPGMAGTANNQTGGGGGRNDRSGAATPTPAPSPTPQAAIPEVSANGDRVETKDPDVGPSVGGSGSMPMSPPASPAPSTYLAEPVGARSSTFSAPVESPSFSASEMPPVQAGATPPPPVSSSASDSPSLAIGQQDTVLVINFHDHLAPPKGLREFDELACGPAGVLRVNEPRVGERLRATSIDTGAWKQAMACVDQELDALKLRPSGTVHLFFNGPHPLALWLGHRFEVVARQRRLVIYQFDVRQQDWIKFLDMSQPSAGRQRTALSNAQIITPSRESGRGTILSIDIYQHAESKQLEALQAYTNANNVKAIKSAAPLTVLSPGDEARLAVEHIFGELTKIRTAAQREPIYLATSAPQALLIGLGKRIPKSVFPPLWCCHYERTSATYFPALEITHGLIAGATRPRLEVISKPHGLLYRLNGTLLEAVGSKIAKKAGMDRRTLDTAQLERDVLDLAEAILPEEVDNAIGALPALDIELRLTDSSSELSWELLSLNRNARGDHFALLKQDWTLTRLYSPRRAPSEHEPLDVGALKVLIVPSLDKNDERASETEAEGHLKLGKLSKMLSDAGVQVWRLDYGVSLKQVEKALSDFEPHILHWVGHGLSDDGTGLRNVLELHDTTGPATLDRTRIPQFIQQAGPQLRLLVMAACYSVSPSSGYGMPGLLLEHGLGAVIGYRDQAGMKELHWFADAFYPALLRGASIRDALAEARSAIHREQGYPASFAFPVLCAATSRAVGPLVKAAHRG